MSKAPGLVVIALLGSGVSVWAARAAEPDTTCGSQPCAPAPVEGTFYLRAAPVNYFTNFNPYAMAQAQVPPAALTPDELQRPRNVYEAKTVVSQRAGLGHERLEEGFYDDADARYTECVTVATAAKLLRAQAACTANRGVVLAMKGAFAAARERFLAAVDLYEQAEKETPAAVERSKWETFAEQVGHGARPVLLTPRAELPAQIAGAQNALLNLGSLSAHTGQYRQAESEFKRALAYSEAHPMPTDIPMAEVKERPSSEDPSATGTAFRSNGPPPIQFVEPGSQRTTSRDFRQPSNAQTLPPAQPDEPGVKRTTRDFRKPAAGQAPPQPQPVAKPEPVSRDVLLALVSLYTKVGDAQNAALYRERAARAAAPPLLIDLASLRPAPVIALEGAALAGTQPADAAAKFSAAVNKGDQRPALQSETAWQRLLGRARERDRAGDRDGAIALYVEAAQFAASAENPDREYEAVANLARLYAERGPREVAIYYGKRAVNASQRVRAGVAALDREARRAFLAQKRATYATLVQLLLDARRLAEAEFVLRLLKQDEGQQFRNDAAAAVPALLMFSADEAKLVAAQDELARRVRTLRAERATLDQKAGALKTREQQERRRIEMMSTGDRFLDQIEKSLSKNREESPRWEQLAAKKLEARTDEESRFLSQFEMRVRFQDRQTTATAASLRVLKRDIPLFEAVVPTPAELAQLDGAIAKAERVSSTLAVSMAMVNKSPQGVAMAGMLDLSKANGVPGAAMLEKMLAAGGVDTGTGAGSFPQRQWEVDRELDQVDKDRKAFDASIESALAGRAPAFTPDDQRLLDGGRRILAELPPGAVAVYYLAGERAVDMLLVSKDTREAFRTAIARGELETKIAAFRAALQDPRRDVVKPARVLFDVLLAPVMDGVAKAGGRTIMLSLDGQLRYMPFAALHDGRGWLAERFAFDVYTSARAESLTARPAPAWRVAAFGASSGGEGLAPLPNVRLELQEIVRDARLQTKGLLPGTIRLDADFTAATLRAALMERQNVVHIASHFVFRPGDASASFLLLGDGARLPLSQIATNDYRFDHVDLVALSACETGLSGADAFGQEVEGLASLLQGQGAAAVLATLWSVADRSTALFMKQVYAARESDKQTRAQAVRTAQLAFIRGAVSADGDAARRGAGRADAQREAAPASDPARPYAHPFYWAPFILMGNWL